MFRKILDILKSFLPEEPKVQVPFIAHSLTNEPKKLVYKLSQEGILLIKSFEGFYPKAYLCSAGVPTIGYGTTIYPDGRKVKLGDFCTKGQAEEFLIWDIAKKEKELIKFFTEIKIPLTPNQYSALVSFAYNLGTGVITNPARSLSKAIREKDYNKIAASILLYNRAGGKVLKGLVRRREAERELFLKA